jgi:DNA-binding response OmpR family regulator
MREDLYHNKNRGPHVEPIYLADRRIVLGPRINQITVDYVTTRLRQQQFALVKHLATHSDEAVSYPQIIQELYGYSDLSPGADENLRDSIRENISIIRQQLGEELGDIHTGAIRTVHRVGFIALSSL